jgi:hypothetical protein
MVDQFNLSVSNQGIPPEEMRAVCCDLTVAPDQLDGMKFDVVVVRPRLQRSMFPP